jgi:hypothetical protein
MDTKTLTEELVLAVVRGQLPLSELEQAGVHFRESSTGNESHERQVTVNVVSPVTVAPRPVDIANGLLTYKEKPDLLREWASFVLGASEIIDLAPLEKWPEGDELLSGLWDASFEGSLTESTTRIATLLAR